MDGRKVLCKGGPSFCGYRRRDPSNEMRPTNNGVEVTRRLTRSWSLRMRGKEKIGNDCMWSGRLPA